jgi:tRNA U38,U39,U40 pseudouridine synthase TruA
MFDPKAKARRVAASGRAWVGGRGDDPNLVDAAADASFWAAVEKAEEFTDIGCYSPHDEAAQPDEVREAMGSRGLPERKDAVSARDYTVNLTTDPDFAFDGGCVERLQAVLRQFEGTHNFHNYTVRTSANSAQAKRYILSFDCQGVFDIQGEPWVRMVVIGQSFMLHQIRKMIGMAIAEFRGVAPSGCLKYALGSSRDVVTPMAPDLGLFLDECYYGNYNERFGYLHEALQLSDFSIEVATFKKERLYPMIAARDTAEIVNASWLSTLVEPAFKFRSWLNNPDAAISTSTAATAAGKRAAAVEVVDPLDGDVAKDLKRAAEDGNEESNQKRAAPNPQWSMKSSINADYSD